MKIHIYLKQTSHNNPTTPRPIWMNYEKCFKNLLDTIDWNICNLTISFDGELKGHFTEKYIDHYPFKIETTETLKLDPTLYTAWSNSARFMCSVIKQDNIPDDDIIYMVDNDYLHLKHWPEMILDLFNSPSKHQLLVSLYDHLDKYIFTVSDSDISKMNIEKHWGMYNNLTSKVYISNHRHWRVVPSICMAWLMTSKMFNDNYDIFGKGIADNTSCGILGERGYLILSPIPSLATHCTEPFVAPLIDWQKILDETTIL